VSKAIVLSAEVLLGEMSPFSLILGISNTEFLGVEEALVRSNASAIVLLLAMLTAVIIRVLFGEIRLRYIQVDLTLVAK